MQEMYIKCQVPSARVGLQVESFIWSLWETGLSCGCVTMMTRHDDDVSLWQRYSGSHNKSTTKSYYNIRDNSNNHEDKKKEKKTGKKTVKKTVNKKEKNNDEHKLNKNRMIFL